MSGPYKCPVGWACWALVGNTTIKTHLEGELVKSTDSNRIIISFYLWLLFYSITNSDIFFEGAISIFSPSEKVLAKKYSDTQFSLLVFHISKSTEYLM